MPAAEPSDRSAAWWHPAVVAATCGGIGRAPAAPGTWGALAGVAVAAALARWQLDPLVEGALVVGANLAAIPLCTAAARRLGNDSDPGAIVLDECASLPLGLLVVPAAARGPVLLATAFLLHRFFDILKPFPCRQLERLPAGLGIMADDWAASAWMALLLGVARWWQWL